MATTSTGQAGGLYLPAQTKIGNRTISPVSGDIDPITKRPVDTIGTANPTTQMQTMTASNNGPTTQATTAAPPSTGVPQTGFTPGQYQSDGYSGQQDTANYNYDPRKESLVQNQITGLLDPNSALMRKAQSQAQGYSASRGLQSSSIGNEIALSTMIDKALPIAQQDAQTFGNADQLGWQQKFQSNQNTLNRQHDASMFDKQGLLSTNLQNQQLSFQNNQANADRQNQAYQLERNAQLTNQRDQIMQQFDLQKMDRGFVQDLEKTKMQYEYNDTMFEKQVGAQAALDYRNATSSAYNAYLEQVAAVYSNPNMTADQQAAGVAKLQQMFEQQQTALQAVYGFANVTPPQQGGPVTNPGAPTTPPPAGVVNPSPSPSPGMPTQPQVQAQPQPVYNSPGPIVTQPRYIER
jgi:hypothetical protein